MHTLPKYLTQDELKGFFAAINSPRDRALFALIYHYGLRVDEATAIAVQDVDLKNHHIRIRRLKNGAGGEKPLWRHTAKLLRAYTRVRKDAGPYLFTGREGPLKKRMVQKLFGDYSKKAGIQGRSVHALRHSIAVHLLEAIRKVRITLTCCSHGYYFDCLYGLTQSNLWYMSHFCDVVKRTRHRRSLPWKRDTPFAKANGLTNVRWPLRCSSRSSHASTPS